MTKSEIIEAVAAGTGLTRIETEAVINGFLSVVRQSLIEGERVDLRGFGNFSVRSSTARVGRNLRTNEAIPIADRYTPIFRFSPGLRDEVDRSLKSREKKR